MGEVTLVSLFVVTTEHANILDVLLVIHVYIFIKSLQNGDLSWFGEGVTTHKFHADIL